MDLFFAGTEQGMWRDLLYAEGVRHMSLSFMGLRRRVKRLDRWRLAEKFPADVKIYLDSGAFTLNRPDSTITASEASNLRDDYLAFVSANIHDLEFASEFDALVLGHDAIFDARETFWNALPDRKWMPVWHADYGASNLTALADSYGRLGVLQDDAGGDLTPVLNRLSGQTRLHGISMTEMVMLREIKWASAGSTSWLSPSRYGDTIVWTGRELKRYPRDMKETGRKRHRTWLREQGFDTDLIEADDSKELLRLSIWSWRKYADSINGVSEVTTPPETPAAESVELAPPPVVTPFPNMWNDIGPTEGGVTLQMGVEVERPRERQLLPVIGFDYETINAGEPSERREARMTTPSVPLLQCNTCFMKDKCPAMQPDQDCVYEIPVHIRTPAQLDAVEASLLEMQVQRVLLMRIIEQREGGYVDANLSLEIGRAWKMLQDRGSGKDTVKLTLEAGGAAATAGMISRVFGERAGARLTELEPPRDTQTVVAEVLEAEVVDEG